MGLLEKVAPARRNRPPRIILSGTPKIGKSTFASEFSSPVFVPIDKEEGIDDVDADAFPVARSVDDVLAACQALLAESHEYKTVAIDSISTLSPLVLKKAMEIEGVNEEQKLGGGYGKEYNTQLEIWMQILDQLDQLRNAGLTTILICHIVTSRFEDPISGSYSKYDIDLPKKILPSLKRWADCILFANWEVFRKSEEVGFNKEHHRAIGGQRKLYTQERPSHPGGGRGVYGRLPYEMPFTAADFKAAVRDEMAKQKESN